MRKKCFLKLNFSASDPDISSRCSIFQCKMASRSLGEIRMQLVRMIWDFTILLGTQRNIYGLQSCAAKCGYANTARKSTAHEQRPRRWKLKRILLFALPAWIDEVRSYTNKVASLCRDDLCWLIWAGAVAGEVFRGAGSISPSSATLPSCGPEISDLPTSLGN